MYREPFVTAASIEALQRGKEQDIVPTPRKGKNFSGNNLGQRKKSDFYETPYSLVWQLLENEVFDTWRSVLEPCCGEGAIVDQLCKFRVVRAYDLQFDHTDFFHEDSQYDYIITNPPFSLAKEFILKAKQVARRKIAMLLPLSYLHGEGRYTEIYQDTEFPLKCIHVFTRYPMLGNPLRPDGKYTTGFVVYAWYVWEKGYTGEPEIKWISNQKYVLSKKDTE